ncbi:hypothetical protein Scep_010986 [Stephania cephalantha]|uniref:Uncharacterized protein n=1 Tax=Stephania cephalantha TaxID=152367 RepID=A0AAP0JX67_9MAGN
MLSAASYSSGKGLVIGSHRRPDVDHLDLACVSLYISCGRRAAAIGETERGEYQRLL